MYIKNGFYERFVLIITRVNDYNMNRVNNDVRTRNVNTTNDLNDNQNKNNNWAWLGLLGLLGLFGLRKRQRSRNMLM